MLRTVEAIFEIARDLGTAIRTIAGPVFGKRLVGFAREANRIVAFGSAAAFGALSHRQNNK